MIKTVWHEYKNRQINQQKTIQSSEIDPYICAQLIIDQGTKPIQWVKKDFLTNASGTIGYFYGKK